MKYDRSGQQKVALAIGIVACSISLLLIIYDIFFFVMAIGRVILTVGSSSYVPGINVVSSVLTMGDDLIPIIGWMAGWLIFYRRNQFAWAVAVTATILALGLVVRSILIA